MGKSKLRNFYTFFYWLFVLKLPFGEEKFEGYYYLVSSLLKSFITYGTKFQQKLIFLCYSIFCVVFYNLIL